MTAVGNSPPTRSPGRALLAGFVLAALLLVGGCAGKPQSLRTTSMQIGSKKFVLEVAENVNEWRTGLMDRDSMPADHGMIFVFPDQKPLTFWMKDTRIPLDVIFLDTNGKVVSVRQMKAMDETDISSEGPAQYAIELNLGQADAAGVLPGDRLTIPAAARAAATTQTAP